jgi:hypothetical protein
MLGQSRRFFATQRYPKVVPFLINGVFVEPTSGQLNSKVRDPATQEVLSRTYLPTAGELEATVQSAHAAFAGWSQTPVVARQRHLFRLLELIKQHEAELVQTIVDELGKTVGEATGDLFRGAEVVEHACSTASLQMGESMQCVSPGIDTLSYREPLGVVAGIVPFNYPAVRAVRGARGWPRARPSSDALTPRSFRAPRPPPAPDDAPMDDAAGNRDRQHVRPEALVASAAHCTASP